MTSTLKDLMRKLFTDHAVYTKFYINSVLSSLPDTDAVAKRLFENQDEIGENFGSIVGKNNGLQLATLLREHIAAAANAVNLLKDGKDLTEAKERIFANSAQVSKFLSDTTKLPYETVKEHFDQHNRFVLELATLRFQKNYTDDIVIYDQYYNHILHFADVLTGGLLSLQATQTTQTQTTQNGGYHDKYKLVKRKYIDLKEK